MTKIVAGYNGPGTALSIPGLRPSLLSTSAAQENRNYTET